MRTDDRIQIGVFFDGPSAGHHASSAAAKAVARGLPSDRYGLVVIGVTHQGSFVLLSEEVVQAARSAEPSSAAVDDRFELAGTPVELLPDRDARSLVVVDASRPDVQLARVDVAFPVMRGLFGEDGAFQGLLECFGARYVGCGVGAAAIGMDKVAMKRAFAAEGIPVGAAEPALMRGDTVIVEQTVSSVRVIACGVLADPEGTLWASLPAESNGAGDLLDFRQKHVDSEDTLTVPAEVPTAVAERISTLALAAFRAIGAAGLAQVDVLWDETADQMYVGDINTMPDFAARSIFARAWEASGVSYPRLLARLIDQALVRAPRWGGTA
jgi:D-alanine-D-alanine ligase